MCVFDFVKLGYLMIESLRSIGMLEMPKLKDKSNRSIATEDKKECVRLLKLGTRPIDVVEMTGVHKSSVLRYQSEIKQATVSKDRY